MLRNAGVLFGMLVCAGLGCSPENTKTRLVTPATASAPPITTIPTVQQAAYVHASTEAGARVDSLGRQLLQCNKQIGLQPLFRTYGDPRLGVWHVGTSEVCITEGLANQCK